MSKRTGRPQPIAERKPLRPIHVAEPRRPVEVTKPLSLGGVVIEAGTLPARRVR